MGVAGDESAHARGAHHHRECDGADGWVDPVSIQIERRRICPGLGAVVLQWNAVVLRDAKRACCGQGCFGLIGRCVQQALAV